MRRGQLNHHLSPVEITRVVVHIPENELSRLRIKALKDGFDCLDDWLAWLGRARVKGMLAYTGDTGEKPL